MMLLLGGDDGAMIQLQIFVIMAVLVYAIDLAGWKDGVLYVVWLFTFVQSLVAFFLAITSSSSHGIWHSMLHALAMILFYACTALWTTLQFEWLIVNATSLARELERALHSVLPPVFAVFFTSMLIGTILFRNNNSGNHSMMGMDAAATAAPYIFAVAMILGMQIVGAATSSFSAPAMLECDNIPKVQPVASNDDKEKPSIPRDFILNQRLAHGHVLLTILTPPIIHLFTFRSRMFSRYASMEEVCDFLLVLVVPYILLCIVQHLSNTAPRLFASPYSVPNINTVSTLFLIIITSLALQQRYLIPICHAFAFHFLNVYFPSWLLTLYWTVATAAGTAVFYFWGRTSVETGQLVFGDYHEDVVQLFLATSGLCVGKAFGLPWNMIPLPILALLGLSLWTTTRMLRYLAIVLFVLHALGVVVFTYRFIGIEQSIALPFPSKSVFKVSLTRFGMIITSASILVGLETGLAIRSTGGYLASTLRQFDAAGLVLIVYTLLLTVLEITLLKRPVPVKELIGVQVEEDQVEEMLYQPFLAYLTSCILIAMCIFMKRVRILYERTASIVISLALGKAVSIFIDSAERDSGGMIQDPTGSVCLCRSIIAALLCLVMFAPRVFLPQVHLKTFRHKRSMNGAPGIPKNAIQTILVYAFVFLPASLLATIPYVLLPLVNVLSGNYRKESYYNVKTPISEVIGATIALWGLACISTINYLLPDGGAEAWKKLSALAFLMGLGFLFAAPTLGINVGSAASNPYASISSLGSQLLSRSKSRTGGWGILSAGLATLLALTGPLELKERRGTSGRKDRYLLFRTMIFSILFGGGVAWFITVQNMSESEWLFLMLTLLASMTLAFLGTVAAVLGYFIEPDNFDEVDQIAKAWFLALCAFLPIGGIPQLIRPSSFHPFGSGGWLSTYLVVACLSAFSFSVALNYRHGKDQRTRGLGNLACVVSWSCAIVDIFGRYGVSGLDANYSMSSFLGIPASVLGSIVVSPILLFLESERSSLSRHHATVTTSTKLDRSALRLNLAHLTRRNRWFPLFMGTVFVFLCSSLYVVLLRGSGVESILGGAVANSPVDIFRSITGSSSSPRGSPDQLAILAKASISHSTALKTAANLAASGFWTAGSFFGPVLHLAGVLATLPSLYLLTIQIWLGKVVPSSQITLGLPLNIVPIVLCRGIPSLIAAAVLTASASAVQLLVRRQIEHNSQMLI
jgi:hypothetical protein